MRVLTAALLTLLLTGPVLAQKAQPPPPSEPPKSPGEIEAERSTDKAYKNSLRNIPDKPPADPWGGARAVEGSGSTASTTTPSKRTKAN
jgi:hypothetical protein